MKNRIAKTIPMALALILMLTMAAGCPRPAEEAPAPAPDPRTIIITDSAGREVEVSLPLERVIVISSRAAEIVHALGAADRVIGITKWDAQWEFLPGFYGKTVVGRWAGRVDLERIIELRPQLVIGASPVGGFVDLAAQVEALAPAGIPVVAIDDFRLATLFDDIVILGKLFDEERAAARLVEFFQAQLDLIEGRVHGLTQEEKVRVFAEYTMIEFVTWGPGSDMHMKIERAGGVNIFADIELCITGVDPEKVIVRNPSVMLMATYCDSIGFGATDFQPIREYLDRLIDRPGWENLEAVKEGRVYLISKELTYGPPAIMLNLFMAKIFHPELFADVDPEALLREYYEEFHGAEFKGIFIYPDP
ncbi:ABC transporter substrate-binding protein [Dehalococcoidia bacterium]|nr:ABC transporter substrate-binding protein [Dehalococcoidia bacterium]MCL0097400.1 ABC transporter substrate-binding protein [Dehalococcoidia bacterium]